MVGLAARRVELPRRPRRDPAVRGPPAEPGQRHRPSQLRDVELLHQPDDRPDRAVHPDGRLPRRIYTLPKAPRRESGPAPPRRPRGATDRVSRRSKRPTPAYRRSAVRRDRPSGAAGAVPAARRAPSNRTAFTAPPWISRSTWTSTSVVPTWRSAASLQRRSGTRPPRRTNSGIPPYAATNRTSARSASWRAWRLRTGSDTAYLPQMVSGLSRPTPRRHEVGVDASG